MTIRRKMMTIPTKHEFLEYIESKNGTWAREWAERVLAHMTKEEQYYYIIGVTHGRPFTKTKTRKEREEERQEEEI